MSPSSRPHWRPPHSRRWRVSACRTRRRSRSSSAAAMRSRRRAPWWGSTTRSGTRERKRSPPRTRATSTDTFPPTRSVRAVLALGGEVAHAIALVLEPAELLPAAVLAAVLVDRDRAAGEGELQVEAAVGVDATRGELGRYAAAAATRVGVDHRTLRRDRDHDSPGREYLDAIDPAQRVPAADGEDVIHDERRSVEVDVGRAVQAEPIVARARSGIRHRGDRRV